ncbi:MAG: hypothetical protein BRC33_05885 [Cyanobacteria bacterium SW_9_44_58]|nr:MAG: hypothetical protein BRC33_05885 [Cyanobacteria bacterium SW_9_44_58]
MIQLRMGKTTKLLIVGVFMTVLFVFSDLAQAQTIGKAETKELREYVCISDEADKDKANVIDTMVDEISSQYYDKFKKTFRDNGYVAEADSYATNLVNDMKPKLKEMAQDIYEVGTLDEYCTEERVEKIIKKRTNSGDD